MSKVDILKNDWNLNRNPKVVKRHEAEEQNDKYDRAIDEELQNDNKINQHGHHTWTMIKSMQMYYTVLSQVVKH